MINHARTLLLNIAANRTQRSDPGYEYIPPEFRPITLPTEQATLYRALFGTAPDNYFLAARARELLGYIHETELAQYAERLDPRITYWPPTNTDFFNAATAQIRTVQTAGPPVAITVGGTFTANSSRGQAEQYYDISLTSVVLQRQLTIRTKTTELVVPVHNTADTPIIDLPGTDLKFFIAPGAVLQDLRVPVRWRVKARANPPAAILNLSLFELLGATLFLNLFGVAPVEPYATFKQLWETHPLPG
jgi:hypothetical protein